MRETLAGSATARIGNLLLRCAARSDFVHSYDRKHILGLGRVFQLVESQPGLNSARCLRLSEQNLIETVRHRGQWSPNSETGNHRDRLQ
jgi:hypothetical protein